MALFTVNVTFDKIEIDFSDRVYDLMSQIADAIIHKKHFYTVRLNLMPRVIKADHADFDVPVTVTVTDSEGNVIPGGGLPAGFALAVDSDNTDCFGVMQDANDPLLIHCHVGTPNADGTPSNANFSATLTDASGALIATDTEAIVVTAGDPSAVSGINLEFPSDIPEN